MIREDSIPQRRDTRIASAAVAALAAISLPLVARGESQAETATIQPEVEVVAASNWAGPSSTGRELPDHAECGPEKNDRFVGIFYFLWLGAHGSNGPYDISRLTAANPTSPSWGPRGSFHHWGEPELGYYVSTDSYVHRRHASMLSDAGVDVVVIDVTNGAIYQKQVTALCQTWMAMRREGNTTPQIAFLAHSKQGIVAQRLYDTLYKPKRFRPLWFEWKGKPLLLAKPADLAPRLRSFFSVRESWAWSHTKWFGDGKEKWAWIDDSPQEPGWVVPGKPEQVAVAAGGHPTRNIGRSHRRGKQPTSAKAKPDRCLHFREQFTRARNIDPEFIFVTGWNEWVAQRFIIGAGNKEGSKRFLGQSLRDGDTYFVDQFNQEFSRDIEPMRGGHGDRYYRQLVAEVRQYKGVPELPASNGPHPIRIDGSDSDWRTVSPEYRDTVGDSSHRDHPAWGDSDRLVDTTGRNDFVSTKATYNQTNICFLAKTREPVAAGSGAWMLLLADTDKNLRTGWHGYDLAISPSKDAHGVARVYKASDKKADRTWQPAGVAESAHNGPVLEIAVPRSHFDDGDQPAFDFHWFDSTERLDEIAGLSEQGDSAPNRRFNYRFKAGEATDEDGLRRGRPRRNAERPDTSAGLPR